MNKPICKHCGRYEEDHCIFEPVIMPKGCKCDPGEWGDLRDIPPVCNKFEPDERDPCICKNCEHDKECHYEPE